MRARPNSAALEKRKRFSGRPNFAHAPALSESPRRYSITSLYFLNFSVLHRPRRNHLCITQEESGFALAAERRPSLAGAEE
jgi:hypothetical protein